MTLSQIAAELGVDAIVEPVVMCLGDSICFNLKMITPDEEQLWIAEYSESKSQIPNLHNLITKQIADQVKIELTADQDQLLAESHTVDPEALDAYFNGLFYLDKIDRKSLEEAREHFNSALELDPNSSIAHYTRAVIAVWTEWNWEKGEQEFLKSLELNPSNAMCRTFFAHLLWILHRTDEASYQANMALKLDPDRTFVRALCSGVVTLGNPQSAIAYHKKTLDLDPNHRFALMQLSVAYRNMGDYEKWFEGWKKITRYDKEDIKKIDSVFNKEGYLAAVEMIIKLEEEAASEKQINIAGHVTRYLELGQDDKAMDWLEKGYEIHHPSMPYIGTKWDQLKDNPRYIELLKKMNLPMPVNTKDQVSVRN